MLLFRKVGQRVAYRRVGEPDYEEQRKGPGTTSTPRRPKPGRALGLLGFETLTHELQGGGVLGNRTYHLLRRTIRDAGLNLEGDRNLGTHQAAKVSDDLLGDLPRIPPHPLRRKRDSTVEALGCRGPGRWQDAALNSRRSTGDGVLPSRAG